MSIDFIFEKKLPSCAQKLDALFPKLPAGMGTPAMVQNCFHPDLTPVTYSKDVIFPCYAAQYLGNTIPDTFLDLQDGYRKTASLAAMDWLKNLLPNATMPKHIHGERFVWNVDGNDFTFCFPRCEITYDEGNHNHFTRQTAAVIPVADTRDNDDDWEQAVTPSYVYTQAMLTLWCYERACYCHGNMEVPRKAFVVRITGNTPGDITIRSIRYDEKAANRLVKRLCRAIDKAVIAGKDPLESFLRKETLKWYEKRDEDISSAVIMDDPNFYAMVELYFNTKGTRKAKDAHAAELESQMQSIAVQLASMLTSNSSSGTVKSADASYRVKHTPTRTLAPKISAKLIKQFCPEHYDSVVDENIVPRGAISIDLL